MKRSEARETAFVLIFERCFVEESLDDVIANAAETRDIEVNEFAYKLASKVYDDIPFLDLEISKYLKKWKLNRISKVALAVLRLSICEIKSFDDIPCGVSINEAVELTKKFAGEEDAVFVNGVLGAVSLDYSC